MFHYHFPRTDTIEFSSSSDPLMSFELCQIHPLIDRWYEPLIVLAYSQILSVRHREVLSQTEMELILNEKHKRYLVEAQAIRLLHELLKSHVKLEYGSSNFCTRWKNVIDSVVMSVKTSRWYVSTEFISYLQNGIQSL